MLLLQSPRFRKALARSFDRAYRPEKDFSLVCSGCCLCNCHIACRRLQATKPAPTASTSSSSIQLQPYTASDQSASAGVPAGWKVTKGAQTVIQMTGPEGETLSLGNTFVAQNAAFKAGQRGASGIDLSLPNTASLAQKLAMIFQQDAAIAGQAAPQLSMTSSTPK